MHTSVLNLIQHVNAKAQSAPVITQMINTVTGN